MQCGDAKKRVVALKFVYVKRFEVEEGATDCGVREGSWANLGQDALWTALLTFVTCSARYE